MKIQNVKGGYDFLPKEQKIRNYINNTLKEIFEQYGYNSIETPILCYYDILSEKYDENNDLLNEIYKLKDQGERKLGLRYDLTVPFAKFIALNKNNITIPFKRYEIAKAFRDGPVKSGRDREFTQCDVDVVGIPGQLIEAELMTLFEKAFKRLELDIIMKYNSRNLMIGIILECGVEEELVPNVTTIIDKLEKISKKDIKDLLLKQNMQEKQIEKLLNCFSCSLEELNVKFKRSENPKILKGLEELNNLTKYLEKLKLNDIYVFTPSLARGQNYYTGNVFEVFDRTGKITCSIGAGGRYDKMITDFINDGTEYPTVGISFGLSAIYELLKDKKIFEETNNLDIFIIPMNTNMESLILANDLRNLGFKVEIEMRNKKLKKSLDYANREKIPFIIILGEEELKKNCFNLKNMKSGEERIISFEHLTQIKSLNL